MNGNCCSTRARHVDADERQRLVGRVVTLRGLPARITDGPGGVACIKPVDKSEPCMPLPWSIVARVCDYHNGRFQ